MTQTKRLFTALAAILIPLLAVGLLLASEPESVLPAEIPKVSAPEYTEEASQSMAEPGTWPILRHDNGHTGFTPDVGVFQPPLTHFDSFTLTDTASDPKIISNIVTGQDRIFAMGQFQIWGVDKDDPSEQWRNDDCVPHPDTGDLCFVHYLSSVDDKLVVLRQNFKFSTLEFGFDLVVLHAGTGLEDWTRPLGETFPEVALDGSSILILTEEGPQGKLLKLTTSNNQIFYKDVDRVGASNARPVVANGRLIYANGNQILAYYTNNGQANWVYTDTGVVDSRDYDLVATSDAVIVTQGERAIKLDISDGTELWNESTEPQTCGSTTQLNASATDGDTILVTGVCDDEVVALDYDDGQEKWRMSIGLQIPSAVAFGGDTLYVAAATSPHHNIFAFDPDSGDLLQEIPIDVEDFTSVLVISDGLLLTASNQGNKKLQRFERMPADVSAEINQTPELVCDAAVGGSVTYSILVTNNGPGTTAATRADLALPDGILTVITDTGSCTIGESPFCELGSLGENQQVHITATVILTSDGNYSPGVSLSGLVSDPDETNDADNTQLKVNPRVPASLDLYPSDIEITQGIQNLDNEVPLVSKKTTFVRVYGQTTGDSVVDVTAVLHGQAVGSGADLGTLSPSQVTSCQSIDSDAPDRDDLNESFVFELPESWLQGEVAFTAEINPNGLLHEADFSNNTLEITRQYTDLPRICLKTYPVRTSGNGTNNLSPHFEAIFRDDGNILSRALTMLPVYEIKVFPSSHLIEEWEPFASGGWGPYEMEGDDDNRGDVLDTLWWLDVFSSDPDECAAEDARTHYVGMVDEDTDNSVGSAGLGKRGGDEMMLFLNTGPNGPQSFDDPHGGFTLAHEIGHNFDRAHVDCGSPAGPGSYPDDRDECNIAPIDQRSFYGLEFRDPTRPTVITPTMAGDVMSYAPDVWTSEYTWEAIQSELCYANDCTFPSSSPVIPTRLSPPPPLDGDVLLVRGYTSPTISISGTVRVPLSQVPEAEEMWAEQVASRPLTATFALNVISGTTILHHEPFSPTHMADQNGELLVYGLIVPWNPQATHMEITQTGSVVISLTVSAVPPTVTAMLPNGGENFTDTLPVSWTAEDLDGDEMKYTVQYSGDGGSSWHALASGLQTTTFEANISLLPGSSGQGLIKVIASDGLNSSYRQSAAGFSVPDRMPEPAIYFPDDGGVYETITALTLNGGAFDPEDGHLEEESLRWYVSGIGEVGTGGSATISRLDNGIYTATMAATDSQSQTVMTTVTFTIQPLGGYVAPAGVNIDGPIEGFTDETLLFEADVTPITTTSPITYVWEATGFETITVSGGASNIRAFTWEIPGQKTVAVTTVNAVGTSTGSHTIVIYEQIVAGFSASPTSGGAPLLVDFINSSSGDFDTCTWDFGDGGSSNDCSAPEHTYLSTGVFTVSLSVSGPGGSQTETKPAFINVEERYYVYIPILNKPD